MGRQRNKFQMKEQENSLEEELIDERESSNLSDREFRVMIMRILNNMKKDIETRKKSEIENETPEIKNTLEGIKSSLD